MLVGRAQFWPIYQYIGCHASWLITQLCWLCYKYRQIGRYRLSVAFLQIKLLVGFKQKILKIALESLRNKFQWEFFSGSHRLTLLVLVQQKQSSLTSLLHHLPIIDNKLYGISFSNSGILLQQPIAFLEGVSAHFLNVYYNILKEMVGCDIFNLPG